MDAVIVKKYYIATKYDLIATIVIEWLIKNNVNPKSFDHEVIGIDISKDLGWLIPYREIVSALKKIAEGDMIENISALSVETPTLFPEMEELSTQKKISTPTARSLSVAKELLGIPLTPDLIKKLQKIKSLNQVESIEDAVVSIFEYWMMASKRKPNRTKLTSTRLCAILGRLADGYTVQDCFLAIDGNQASDFHQGRSDNNQTVYDEIAMILHEDKIEKMINYLFRGQEGAKARKKPSLLSTLEKMNNLGGCSDGKKGFDS
jgi:hypothetical protein